MIQTRQSGATEGNPRLRELPRKRTWTNRRWLADALRNKEASGWILLIGGAAVTDFRLRIAQSHARQDLLPSFWSHAALLRGPAGRDDWSLYEVGLEPPGGFGPVPKTNGVQTGRASQFDDPKRYPNIACIHFPMKKEVLEERKTTFSKTIETAVASFQRQRSLVDMGTFLVEWLAFIWGAGEKGNPLLKGIGVPSAVFVESAFSIAGLEVTPGIASQSSCPEALWQSAKWWHGFYESEAAMTDQPPEGRFCIGQPAAAVTAEA